MRRTRSRLVSRHHSSSHRSSSSTVVTIGRSRNAAERKAGWQQPAFFFVLQPLDSPDFHVTKAQTKSCRTASKGLLGNGYCQRPSTKGVFEDPKSLTITAVSGR